MRFACRKFSKTGAPRFFVPTFALTLQLANKLSRNDERPWPSVRLLRPSTSPHPTPSSSTSWWSQQETPSSSSANSPGFFRPSDDIRRSPVHLGLPTPSTFPSRRFSRPQGFTSPATSQPCFVLLPPVGFSPSERFPPEWPATVSGPDPHMALHDLAVIRPQPGEPSLVRTPCRSLHSPLMTPPSDVLHSRPFASPPGSTIRKSVFADEVFNPAVNRCSPGVSLLQGTSFHRPAIHRHPL